MKKILALMLAALLALSLWGCNSPEQQDDSVSFYYQRAGGEYLYGQEDGVIAAEPRDISGNRDNLNYLLTLYFHGPLDPALIAPFPADTTLVELVNEGSILKITLSNTFAQLENMELTIACTGLAKTCFDLCDAETVLIETENGSISIMITRDNYLLIDSIPASAGNAE